MTLPIIPPVLELNLGSTFKAASSSYIARIPELAEILNIAVLSLYLQIAEPEGASDLSNLSLSHSRTSAPLKVAGSYSIADKSPFNTAREIRHLVYIGTVPSQKFLSQHFSFNKFNHHS